MRLIWALFFLLLTASGFSQDNARIEHEFIVLLKHGHSIADVVESNSVTMEACLSPRMNIWLLRKDGAASSEQILYRLQNNPHVQIAQYNHTTENRGTVPNDAFFSEQWGMENTGQNSGVIGADIEATEAWDISNSAVTALGDSVVVAVIDGKFDLLHEDLNFFVNHNEIPGNNIDDDGNGYVDDVQGWNAYNNGNDVSGGGFSAQHGTHVSGIAGARGNNGLGVAGVCWGAKILPISGSGSDEATVVIAYNYAREMRMLYDSTNGAKGAFVVSTNSSFGVNNGNPINYPLWCAMYDSMGRVGILSATATANSNADVDIVHDIPTECGSEWMIGVTNTTRNDARNGGAAYGKISVDLGAPGTGVYSTTPANAYANLTGTSMATPHVAGSIAAMYVAACPALLRAYKEHPDSIALLMKQYLLDGTEWLSGLNNLTLTNGRLNLYRAFQNLRKYNCDSCNFSFDIAKVDIRCHNETNGALALNGLSNFGNYTYLWSTGNTSIEILNVAPGFYTLKATDSTGCRRYATASLHNPDSIAITSVNVIPALDGNTGNITIVASTGNETLLYSIDGTTFQSSPIFTISANGNYTVYVKNSSGCIVEKNIFISGFEDLALETNFSLFPNPVNEMLHIQMENASAAKNVMVEVFELSGRKISEQIVTTNQLLFNTSSLAEGCYFVKVGTATKKFAVVR